jgi:hypothetical protein
MTARRGARLVLALCALWFALSGPLAAQRLGSITGTVKVSARGAPIEGSRVILVGTLLVSTTNARGEFSFHGLVPGKYVIQASAIGYSTLSSPIEVKSLETLEIEFEVDAEAARLPDIEVSEKPNLPPDFLRRLERGDGHYFTREQIARRNPATTGDLLRSVPGVRVNCRPGRCIIQMARAVRNCYPTFWIDGQQVDMNIMWQVPPNDLDGIEVYSGMSQVPAEFSRGSTCGAVALWTRTPPRGTPKEKKPKAKPDSIKPPADSL